jgi:hypothetical protein
LTTTAIQTLSNQELVRGELLRGGREEEAATHIAAQCARAAFRLLLAGLDGTPPTDLPRSAEQLRKILRQEGVNAWRGVLANISAHPWGPAASRLEALASEADLPDALRAIQACERVYRSRMEEDERVTISQEIRRLVRQSGRTQSEFARAVGTSASRLSTYVNGGVVPSSTMFLRMQRVAALLAETATSG